MTVHRFLSPETAACFDGVTTTQVRADLTEVRTVGRWEEQPEWLNRLEQIYGRRLSARDEVEQGLRFIADRERAEIAGRLRDLAMTLYNDTSPELEALADQLDPKD